MGRALPPRSVRPRSPSVEPLEARQLFSVSLNSAGWTVVTPSGSARHVYVSSSGGKDTNSGLSSSSPVRTLAAATALMRSGTDDEMFLRRGDTWATSFPQWTKSGASAADPMLITAYGTGNRPTIDTGTGDGLIANSKSPVDHLVLQDVVFIANGRDPALTTVSSSAAAATPTGLQLLGPSTDVTVEGCSFSYFKDNVVVEGVIGSVSDITIRRSTIADSYCTSAHSQGVYAAGMTGLTLDQDVIDHNGWNASVAGAGTNGYDHDVYAYATATGLTVTNCVISNAAFAGIMARGGGTIDGNLFLNNCVAVCFGTANGALSTAGGVRGQIENNVVMGDHAVGATKYGEGVEVGNTAKGAGVTVSGNVFAGDDEQVSPAITLTYASGTTNPAAAVGLNDTTVADNVIYGWRQGISLGTFADGKSGLTSLNGLTVTGNQVQGTTSVAGWHQGAYSSSAESWSGDIYSSTAATNAWFRVTGTNQSAAQWKAKVEPTAIVQTLAYVDPTRSAATYAGSLGRSATVAAFVAAAAAQSDTSWSTSLTAAAAVAYIKAGFALKNTTTTPTLAQRTGTTIGTAGSYAAAGNIKAKATDGSLSTFFDGPTASGNWVGLDLGSAESVSQIRFAPRAGWTSRMVGGVFQASTTADFSSGVSTLYTVKTTPASGALTTVALTAPVTARYFRYLSPGGSYGNVAEVQFYG